MTSVPEITRLLAKIHEWQEGHGKPGGRADAARRLDEAHKLFDEITNMLAEMRRGCSGADIPWRHGLQWEIQSRPHKKKATTSTGRPSK